MAKIIKRNVDASEKGTWVNNCMGDICIKIAAENNKNYSQIVQKLMKPYQRSYRSMGDSFNAIFEDIQNKAMSKAILLDWKYVEDDNGAVIEYSETAAYDLLRDPENIEFRKLVVDLSAETEVFRKETQEALADKS